MSTAIERFCGFSRALRWRPDRLVAMLWAYFDGSGLHKPPTNNLDWLVMGGAIAREDMWAALTEEWDDALSPFSLSLFHMADFEAYEKPFDKLSRPEHEALLNALLDIQGKYITNIFGVTNHTGVYRGKFCKIYRPCLRDILTTVCQQASPLTDKDDEISIMFAAHDDISIHTVTSYFEDMKAKNKRLAECVVGRPEKFPALQLADIVAYELSRSIRENGPERYPLKRMKQIADIKLFLLMGASLSARISGRAALSPLA
jgi:Protein of unknown function (DUF3800)